MKTLFTVPALFLFAGAALAEGPIHETTVPIQAFPKSETAAVMPAVRNVRVSGTVRDAVGEAVIGASILVKGSTLGTITDVNGKFSIDVPENTVLVISSIGYVSREVSAGAGGELGIVLEADAEILEEVTVVGFGTQKKVDLTGAISSVKMDEVLGSRPVTSTSSALKGMVPGLQITGNSGSPGANLSLNVRGTNSINGGEPLVMVDNMKWDINLIDPNDIESISVLKDAAASAIYGAEAAFGVILITTKKGRENQKLSINYTDNFSFSRAADIPRKATPLETVQAYKDMGWVTYRTGENVDTWLGLLQDYQANPLKYPDGYANIDGMYYYLQQTDVIGDMLETGFQQSHNLSVSGGSRDISYRMAFGMIDQNGILKTDRDSFKRYNVSAHIRSTVFKWITPELDMRYTKSDRSVPTTTAAYGIWGGAVAFPSYFPLGYVETAEGTLPINSPRNYISLGAPSTKEVSDARVIGKVTITPVKDLNIIAEYTFDRNDQHNTANANKFAYANGNSNFNKEYSTANSQYTVYNYVTNYSALNIYASYTKKLRKHEFSVMAGFNQESSFYHATSATRYDMINENLPSLSQGTGEYNNAEAWEEYRTRSLFYRINYSFAGKYLIETNGRYDGSSKFPSGSRFGFFPSVSAGWRISEEGWMRWSKPALTNLKFRLSYGSIGNQNVAAYQYTPAMAAAKANWIPSDASARATTLNPPALVSNSFTWEKVTTLNFGIDLGLFKDRLVASFDRYGRDTKGMLAPGMELPAVLGANAATQNVANLRSNGWELNVDWHDRIGAWGYYLGFNLYDARTRITKYDNVSQLIGGYYREGMELGEIWGYTTDRLYTDADFDASGKLLPGIPYVKGYPTPNPGDILYKDFDGNGIIDGGASTAIDPGDRKIIGNNTRRYNYGIRGGVDWKGIS
ncbi:MAG: TonB-dependent receptor, partial [Bacteroidales bacterium]|nr:TonB-dependent receptor [Bacteroidales bacterium]